MAATNTPRNAAALLTSAALALPLVGAPACAEAFESAQIGYKFLRYDEAGRMAVNAPLLWFEASPDADTQIAGSADLDSLSGASPQYVSNRTGAPVHTLSGASIQERRRGGEVRVRRNFGESNAGLALSTSKETDYHSDSLAGDVRFDFNERNTTLALGYGHTQDKIGKHGSDLWNDRTTDDFLLGLTQLLSPVDIVQSNLTYSTGRGYFNDPYKYTMTFTGSGAPLIQNDSRPDHRRSMAWLTRYRHYLPSWQMALGGDYRFYRDDWGIRAHTVDLSAAWQASDSVRITPSVRYHSQGAADFFANTFPTRTAIASSDARLGSFGAWTAGLKLVWALTPQTSVDVSGGAYRQRASYRLGGNGTANFPDLDARYMMVGMNYSF